MHWPLTWRQSRSSCASIFTAGMTFVAAPAFTYTCATVTFTPLGLWVRKIANMSYEMSRGGVDSPRPRDERCYIEQPFGRLADQGGPARKKWIEFLF